MNRINLLLIPLFLGLAALSGMATGCSSEPSQPPASSSRAGQTPPPVAVHTPAPNPKATYTAAPPVGDVKEYEKMQAVIETDKGPVTIEFFPNEAPKTVASFIKLSRDGFYDGLTFHRVVEHFVVQGGDPEGSGAGGPGFKLPAEFNDHKHERGAVAMARTNDPNSAGSQFYIVLEPAPSLDNKYTVFGHVTSGMDNVDKIVVGDKIKKITIEPKKKK